MSETGKNWANRIVGHGEVAPDQLLAHPDNFRRHSKSQQDAMTAVFEEVGWVQSVIVSERSGRVIDGHMRVELAMRNDVPTVPVVYVELSEEEERKALATIDPMGALATADAEQTKDLLVGLNMDDERLSNLLGQLAKQSGGAGWKKPEEGDLGDLADYDDFGEEESEGEDGDIPDAPTRTALGEVWKLGRHRLVVGKAEDPDNLARAMKSAGVKQVDMVWTDPPYGVAIGDKNVYLDSISRGSSNRITENLINDAVDEDVLQAMLAGAFDNAFAVCRKGAVWHVFAPTGPLFLLFGAELVRLGIWRQTIQWVKNNATFSPMGVDYHWQSEPFFHGWVPGAKHVYLGDRTQTNVWNVDRPSASPEHPTMKPVALAERSILNHTKYNDVVLDMFAGSGTAILACQKLDRICISSELAPHYADIILRRWENMTGEEAVRDESV